MDINQPTPLVIKEHDFQEAKNALKKYAEQAEEKIELVGVPTKGGLFHLGNHKVTGSELNDIISSTQNYLINIYKFNQDIIKEFEQVYKAFESLDKGYIAGIVTSIKAAAEVSKQEQKDRRDITARMVK